MSVKVSSIQIGRVRAFQDESGKQWESAIVKTKVTGPAEVGKLKIVGDEQADLRHHGGADKAVLAYSEDHFQAWAAVDLLENSSWRPHAGSFGENLTISGQVETDVCIGDVYQVGRSRLEVSQPRQPCWKLSRRWKIPRLAVYVQENGRTGWYLRVLDAGTMSAGDSLELLARPNPDWTIARAHAIMHAKPRNIHDDLALSKCPALSQSWSDQLTKRALKANAKSESARLFGSN